MQILGKVLQKPSKWFNKASGDQSLNRTQVFQWHARFKAGRTSVDDEQTGRRTSSTTPETVARIQEIIRHNRRPTIRDIVKEVHIGYGTCQRILTEELCMNRVAAKFLTRILTADQMQQRVSVCTELRQLGSDDETFLSRVITDDKSWVYGYDPETKRNPPSGKSPRHHGLKCQRGEKQSQEHVRHFL